MRFSPTGLMARLLAAALILAAVMLLAGCKAASGQDEEEDAEEVVTVPVEAVTAVTRDISAFYSGTATLEADERATIVSQTTGVVLEVLAEEGDFVEGGQVLARLETDRYRLEVQRAQAEYSRLQTDFDRKKELFERELVSAEAFEQVRANLETARAEYDLAKLDLHYTSIRAPFTGYIAERLVRVGNLVSNLDPVFRITSYDPLLAVLHVPERELRVLGKGLPVSVAVDAWPGERFEGVVTRISPVIDPETGTFRVTAEIQDRDGMLKPGLFGRVQILYDTHANVTVIPRSAVISEDDENHVYVISEDSTVNRRAVEVGYEKDGMVEITAGVQAGEQVVTAGKGSLNNGATVEVIGNET